MTAPLDEEHFARRMADLRTRQGMSQSELARRMTESGFPNYSQMTVSRTEKGERPIRLGEARVLAGILGSSVDQMTRGPYAAELIDDIDQFRQEMETLILNTLNTLQDYHARLEGVDDYRLQLSTFDKSSADAKLVAAALSSVEMLSFPVSAVAEWAAEAAVDMSRDTDGPSLLVNDVLRLRELTEQRTVDELKLPDQIVDRIVDGETEGLQFETDAGTVEVEVIDLGGPNDVVSADGEHQAEA